MSGAPDLLVLGGGPAGATTAALAAAAGVSVMLVERATFPRDKVCGEFVSAEGCRVLERLGLLDRLVTAGARRMDRCAITDRGGRRLELALPRLPVAGRDALGVSRGRMDHELLELARRSGAQILERHEAVRPVIDDGRVVAMELRRVGSDRTFAVRPRLIVAADGRRSILARRLHPQLCDPLRSDDRSWFGLKAHFRTGSDALGGRVELHVFDGGYAGLAAIEDATTNLCMLATVGSLRACGGSPDRLFRERVLDNPAARERLGSARRSGSWKTIGPLRFNVRRAAAAGAMFVGDAAGTIDPFCGEGMSNALRGAELALPIALDAIQRGGLDHELARAWTRRWNSHFSGVTRRARLFGRFLERPALASASVRLLSGIGRGIAPRIVASSRTGWKSAERT